MQEQCKGWDTSGIVFNVTSTRFFETFKHIVRTTCCRRCAAACAARSARAVAGSLGHTVSKTRTHHLRSHHALTRARVFGRAPCACIALCPPPCPPPPVVCGVVGAEPQRKLELRAARAHAPERRGDRHDLPVLHSGCPLRRRRVCRVRICLGRALSCLLARRWCGLARAWFVCRRLARLCATFIAPGVPAPAEFPLGRWLCARRVLAGVVH